jgi:hypothetical protein
MAWQDDPIAQTSSGGWQNDPVAVPAIDFNRPVEAVRADIAKLPQGQRELALPQWADAFVAKEKQDAAKPSWWRPMPNSVHTTSDDAVRSVARGTFFGPFLDEITAGSQQALYELTGGRVGSPYDEALAYQRARDRAADQAAPGTTTALKIAGGVAGGVGALRNPGAAGAIVGGPLAAWQPAATLPRQVAQGAATGGLYGQVAGFGNAEGGVDQRMQGMVEGATMGAGIGAVLPPAVAAVGKGLSTVGEAVSPQVARFNAWRNQPASTPGARVGMSAQAFDDVPSGAGGASTAGADAAAEQIIANQLTRANVPVNRLMQQLTEADEAARFYGGGTSASRAQNVLAPVDLDPSLQRLAGSVFRKQPEAASEMIAFGSARQTGQTPKLPLSKNAGLPTRRTMAQAQPDDRPMGQYERVRDGLKRALVIQDKDFHGHAANAYRTEKQIIAANKAESVPVYKNAYKAAEGVDLRPTLSPIMQRWGESLIDEPAPVAAQLQKAMRLVERALSPEGRKSHLERADKVKQWLDDQIDRAFTSTNGRQRYLGGRLTEFKNEMVAALDSIPKAGPLYAKARGVFSSNMESLEALNLGRSVFKEDGDVVADQFKALTAPGLQKLARLGVLDGFEKLMGRQKRSADITQMFENPRIQGILQEVIPRTETATGRVKAGSTFSNRPERFGQFLGNEKDMIRTRDEVFGNSKTQQRSVDDAAFEDLNNIVEQFKGSPSATQMGFQFVQSVLNRTFGMRADTATSISRMLFTADPAERARVLQAIEARMGPTRAERFAQMMQDYQRVVSQASAVTASSIPEP